VDMVCASSCAGHVILDGLSHPQGHGICSAMVLAAPSDVTDEPIGPVGCDQTRSKQLWHLRRGRWGEHHVISEGIHIPRRGVHL